MNDNVDDPIAERIEQLIADEDATLERVTSFVEQALLGAWVTEPDAERLIDAAQARRDIRVRVLRDLLLDDGADPAAPGAH